VDSAATADFVNTVFLITFLYRINPSEAFKLGCLQLLELEILEVYWNLKSILEILEISWNLIVPAGKFYIIGR